MEEYIKILGLSIPIAVLIFGWIFTMLNKRIEDLKEYLNKLEEKVNNLERIVDTNDNYVKYCYYKIRKLENK